MTTKEVINELLRFSPSSSRVDLRSEINAALRIIFDKPLEIMRVKDSSTGKDPLLATTAGVFEYTIDASAIGVDAKFVTRVYREGDEKVAEDCDPVVFNTRVDLYSGNVVVIFEDDPNGESFHITAYRHHDEIVSETVPAVFPLPDHLIQRYLIKLVAGRLEDKAHNRSIKEDAYYEKDEFDLHNKLNGSGSHVYYGGLERRY